MITQEQIDEVTWFARSWSVSELLENNDPDGIVEIVGDWVDDNIETDSEDDWSDLCFVFYEFWGCENIPSSTPEWDKFWNDKLIEETE